MKKIRFVDCGANIGQSAQWALENFSNYELVVDSFEPLPENFNKLKNRFENEKSVRVHNLAVNTFDGDVTFYHQTSGALTGGSVVRGKSGLSDNIHITAKGIDIAKWILANKNDQETIILKIDIEGLEYEVLPHLLVNNVQTFVDWWLVEFHGAKVPIRKSGYEGEFKGKVKNLIDWGKSEFARSEMEKMGFAF